MSPVLAALAVLFAVLGARAAYPTPFLRLQALAFDTLQRGAGRPLSDGGRDDVVVIDIDDASLAQIGQWPWPRDTVAELIEVLQDSDARAIGLDIVFSEADRTSPRRLAADWTSRLGLAVVRSDGATGRPLPDNDDVLARVFARGRVVAGFGLIRDPNGAGRPKAGGLLRQDAAQLEALPPYRGAIRNLPALEQAAADQGSFMVAGETDEIIRRMPLVLKLEDAPIPSLVLSVLRLAHAQSPLVLLRGVRSAGMSGAIVGYDLEFAGRRIPLEADGSMRLRFSERGERSTVSAAQVLAAKHDPEKREALRQRIAGRIVLVGASALGLVDRRATPFDGFEPGVNIHAGAIEQILRGDILVRPYWAGSVETFLAVAIAVAAATLVAVARLRWSVGLLTAVVLGAASFAWVAYRCGVLVDASLMLGLPPLAFVTAALTRHYVAEREARALRTAFKQYLSPDLVETLARDPSGLRLGGEEREMTFLFTDVEGFTSFTERSEPSELVGALNAYLDGVCAVAFRHGGTIDKIVGDAVHVMFNAPLDQPDHASRAVACALEIDAFARGFAAQHTSGFGVTRIGVNTGPAVVGNFGGARRFDYTAHGDAINTAARLEAINKRFGTSICVSQATVERTGEVTGLRFRAVGGIILKGKAAATEIYTVVVPTAANTAHFDRYDAAFEALARRDPGASDQMRRVHADDPQDPLAAFHAGRLDAGDSDLVLNRAA